MLSFLSQVTICQWKEVEYQVQHHHLGYYLPHLDLWKLELLHLLWTPFLQPGSKGEINHIGWTQPLDLS
jgi:hypothetical protein